MSYSSFIDRFINDKDKQHPDTYRKGKFFLNTVVFFFLLNLAYVPFFFLDIPGYTGELMWGTLLVGIIPVFSIFYIYPRYGKRVLLVNILAALGCFGSNYATFTSSGGIYSSELALGIVICSWIFLVANKASGYFWAITQFILFLLMFLADYYGYSDFKGQVIQFDGYYWFVNYSLALLFIMLIIREHENGKEKYLNEVMEAKDEIESKNKEIETKNKDITDSINYSKKIQFAVLPHEETIQRSIPLFFILYKPKDIVSGDFYWFHEINNDEYIIICADCTGHGVPGAFMTVICSTILNQVVVENKIHQPSEILKEVDAILAFTLKQESKKEDKIRDGMDLCLLKINKVKKEAVITGAKRPAFFIHNGVITDVKNSKFSVGGLVEEGKLFQENKFIFEEEDMFFLYTDGFTDQFGGPDNKKFMTRRLRELVTENCKKSLPEQNRNYDNAIETWKGTNEQTDDILMIGVRL